MGTKIATGLKARLHHAETEQTAVAVPRAIRRADGLDGYVVGIGSKWLCLAVLNCNRLNGFAAVRLDDVHRIMTLREDAPHRTALASVGQWPPAAPVDPIDLDSTRRLVASVHAEGTWDDTVSEWPFSANTRVEWG